MNLVLLIVVVTGLVSYAAFQQPALMERLLMKPYAVRHGHQWYRLITSGFVHANWPHLIINMLVFYSFGTVVLKYYQLFFPSGTFYFLILYLAGIAVSDLPTLLRYQNNPYYGSLGASGAVSAVTFAFVLIDPRNTIYLMAIIPMPAIVWGVAYLAYSHYMSYRGGDNINHSAHFYGAVFGLVFTLLLKPTLLHEFIRKLLAG